MPRTSKSATPVKDMVMPSGETAVYLSRDPVDTAALASQTRLVRERQGLR